MAFRAQTQSPIRQRCQYGIQCSLHAVGMYWAEQSSFGTGLVIIPQSPDTVYHSGPGTAPSSCTSPGHPAAFQGPRLLPPGQQQMGLPPAPQLPPPPANSVNGFGAQPALPPMARQGAIPGPAPPNPNLQHLPGQPPGPGYHPQQGREGCWLCDWKQSLQAQPLVELYPLRSWLNLLTGKDEIGIPFLWKGKMCIVSQYT